MTILMGLKCILERLIDIYVRGNICGNVLKIMVGYDIHYVRNIGYYIGLGFGCGG